MQKFCVAFVGCQDKPVEVELSATSVSPFAPTARRAGVSAALAAIRSPLASTIAFWIALASSVVTHVKSISVPVVLLNTCPVLPPLRSTREASIESPRASIAVAPSFTRSVEVGTGQLKLGVTVAIRLILRKRSAR